MFVKFLQRSTLFTLCLVAGIASASTPGDVDDLVGVRASSGERALENRGYVHINSERGPDRIWAHWWNPRSRTCLNVNVINGRYEIISSAPAFDCNQNPSAGGDDDDDQGKAAAIAIGAAALIGALALSHKSHHHEDNEHYDDHEREADYERGYQDGLHNHSYNNFTRSDAYSNGYKAGVDAREHHGSSHRERTRYHAQTGGYDRSVRFDDLEGARASSADGSLRNRGFRDVDSFRSGSGLYTIWYRGDTRQCLQMTVADGRVEDIRDIHTHPNCR